jgi:hypothetical protein
VPVPQTEEEEEEMVRAAMRASHRAFTPSGPGGGSGVQTRSARGSVMGSKGKRVAMEELIAERERIAQAKVDRAARLAREEKAAKAKAERAAKEKAEREAKKREEREAKEREEREARERAEKEEAERRERMFGVD